MDERTTKFHSKWSATEQSAKSIWNYDSRFSHLNTAILENDKEPVLSECNRSVLRFKNQ